MDLCSYTDPMMSPAMSPSMAVLFGKHNGIPTPGMAQDPEAGQAIKAFLEMRKPAF